MRVVNGPGEGRPHRYLRAIPGSGGRVYNCRMPAPNDIDLLTQALVLAALVAGALEYAILIRHRVVRRAEMRTAEAHEIGLRGLVRVMLADAAE